MILVGERHCRALEGEREQGDMVVEARGERRQEGHGEVLTCHGIAMPLMVWSMEKRGQGRDKARMAKGRLRGHGEEPELGKHCTL